MGVGRGRPRGGEGTGAAGLWGPGRSRSPGMGSVVGEALAPALRQSQSAICTTEQGASFPRVAVPERLQKGGLRLSMDGRGRALDQVLGERWWRTVKSAEVSVHDDHTAPAARQSWGQACGFYPGARGHQALGYRTPAARYQA